MVVEKKLQKDITFLLLCRLSQPYINFQIFKSMRNDKENLIVDLSMNFALDIVDFCDILEQKRKYVIANQLLKAGTSIGANVSEAQNGESKADFIHKIKIAAKEADEVKFWLSLCERSPKLPFEPNLKSQLQTIVKVLSKIISSSKSN